MKKKIVAAMTGVVMLIILLSGCGGNGTEVPVDEKMCIRDRHYSGSEITADTRVTMTGEHVLTAEWK